MTKEQPLPRFRECKKLLGLSMVANQLTVYRRKGEAWDTICVAPAPDLPGSDTFDAAGFDPAPVSGLKAGVDSWVVDTGSGHHLIARPSRNQEERNATREADELLKLTTANGIIRNKTVTDSRIHSLDDQTITCRVLDRTPRVLSVAKLVDEGFAFMWNERGAFLRTPNGIWKNLEVQMGVPLIALPALDDGEVETTRSLEVACGPSVRVAHAAERRRGRRRR